MNENLLKKYQNGKLTDEQILAADVAVKRAAIEAEAERLTRIRIEQETKASVAEHRIQKMVFLDREAEAATRDLENLLQEFDEFCFNFGRKFLAARYRIVRAQMAFGREINAAVENVNKLNSRHAPETENQLSELLERLESAAQVFRQFVLKSGNRICIIRRCFAATMLMTFRKRISARF